MSKGRNIAAWVFTILGALAPAYGVVGKFTNETMMDHMTQLGFGDWLPVIAIGELVAVVTFVIPKTSRIGLLLITALMGGAIAVHWGADTWQMLDPITGTSIEAPETFTFQAVVLALCWVGGFLRNPDMFKLN